MKKNSKILAALLAFMLILTFPVTALAAETPAGGTIGGDSTVENAVLNVMLPTSLDFALDPLGLVSADNQVAPTDYFFVNETLAPVKVELSITATLIGGAVLVNDTADLSPDDPSVTDKEIYFAALGAKSVTGTAISEVYQVDESVTDSAVITTGASGEYDYTTGAATRIAFTPSTDATTGSAVIGFALEKGVESATTDGAIESLAAGNAGVAAFQFYGALNTYAGWEANDITVSGAYTLTPLRTTTYTDFASDFLTNSLNQIATTPPTPPTPPTPYGGVAGFITGPDTTVTDLAAESAVTVQKSSASDVSIPFYFAGYSISSMSIDGYPITAAPVLNYESSGDNLILNKDGAAGVAYTWDTASSIGNKTIVMTLSSGGTYSFVVNFTN